MNEWREQPNQGTTHHRGASLEPESHWYAELEQSGGPEQHDDEPAYGSLLRVGPANPAPSIWLLYVATAWYQRPVVLQSRAPHLGEEERCSK